MTIDNVINIAHRLRDGRAIEMAEDYRQWVYEYLDRFSRELGMNNCPAEHLPAWIKVMTEWIEAISGIDAEIDRETAQALANAISELAQCLNGVIAGVHP
jgi:hypothetical protein